MASNPALNPTRERQLIDQVRRGDRGALGELLEAYHRRVYHVVLRMVGDEADAADLTQEAMLKAVRHIDGFKGDSRFSTWLFRIAMNLAISHLRKRKRRQTVSLDDGPNNGRPDGGGNQAAALKHLIASHREPPPDRSVETDERLNRLRRAIDRLDEPMRAVLVLRDLQEMDYQQIGEVLSLPAGTVKSRLFRARLALRSALTAMSRDGTRIEARSDD